METLQRAIASLKGTGAALAGRARELFRIAGEHVQRSRAPSFTSIKWLSSRHIRQQYFEDQFRNNPSLFDKIFADVIDKKREEAEKQFLKVALIQITITGFMLLALMKASISFSILGILSADAYKLRGFLLFCHAATVSWSIVLQQHHHKLEDILVAWVKLNTPTQEALPPMSLRFLGPIETFNVNVLP
jgi:hypothetical protein